MNVRSCVGKTAIAIGVAVCGMGLGGAASAADTVQVNIKSLLNARSVTTFSNGKLYTWKMGIDGGGTGDGYGTHSAAVHLTPPYTGHTLPDSALYPANSNHPTMILNFSNSDSADFQTHYIKGSDSVTFSVPQGKYSAIYLALMSAEGSTVIKVVLNYSDGPVTSTFTLNDYNQPLATGVFHVDSNMQKWSTTNVPVDNPYHNLDGFCVTTNSSKTLDSVKLVKTTAGSYVTFWGVTGVRTGISALTPPSVSKSGPDGVFAKTTGLRTARGIQFVNVPSGTELSVYSGRGRLLERIAASKSSSLAFNCAVPGVYICTLTRGKTSVTRVLVR
jgi:hypothetical protein